MDLEQELQSKLFRAACPPTEKLSDFHLGLLPESEEAMIIAHLAICDLCQAEINALAMFLDEVADTIKYRDLHTPQETPLRRWVARLGRLGSGNEVAHNQTIPAFTFRGNEDEAQPKPQHFTVGDTQIMLDVQSDMGGSGRLHVIGTVMSDLDEFTRACLRQKDALSLESEIDDMGGFEFEHLESGRYEIVIEGKEHRVIIPSVSI